MFPLLSLLMQHGAPAADSTPHVIGGADPLMVAGIIFVITYAFIMSEKFNRAVVSLLGGGLMILSGVFNQTSAVQAIDWNTIGLLTGMMIIVAITRRSGVFQYLAIWSAKKVKAKPWGILVMLSIVTAILSAMLDNVTTVLLIAPVTLLITEELEIAPYPFLFSEIIFSNIGGAATLIGDPPNILIGSMVESITFNDFLIHIAPIVPLVFIATLLPIYIIWGRKLHATDEARQRVLNFREADAIKDSGLLIQAIAVLSLVLAGFVFGHPIGIEPATVAMTGAALLMLIDNLGKDVEAKSENVHHTSGEVEWVTIFFFVGLFVVIGGLEAAGALEMLAAQVVGLTDGITDSAGVTKVLALGVLWISAIASAIVDNIPFVATMIPTLKSTFIQLAENGVDLSAAQEHTVWWALSLGACFGGNGSLIGASANLIVAGFAERAGHPIKFVTFLKTAFPLMILSIIIASGYLWLRYL
ncbi:MAG: Na+/H+ antiporter NhaD/arsenite permease-like protein [Myxococcota bacterium]|jgi:Na+/H+ antiporter NhaD/arsenite permease-like protein